MDHNGHDTYKTDEIEISIDMTIDNYIHLTDITDDEIIYA